MISHLAPLPLPLFCTLQVALYLSGGPDVAQHLTPVPPDAAGDAAAAKGAPTADLVATGPGSYPPPEELTSGSATPHAAAVPAGLLQFNATPADGPTFVSVSFVPAGLKQTATLQAAVFDAAGVELYAFSKENPRTAAGHTAGDLKAPPGPGFAKVAEDGKHNVQLSAAAPALPVCALWRHRRGEREARAVGQGGAVLCRIV